MRTYRRIGIVLAAIVHLMIEAIQDHAIRGGVWALWVLFAVGIPALLLLIVGLVGCRKEYREAARPIYSQTPDGTLLRAFPTLAPFVVRTSDWTRLEIIAGWGFAIVVSMYLAGTVYTLIALRQLGLALGRI